MSEYKDYGYKNAEHDHSHTYILGKLVSLLNIEHNKSILDLGCGNGSPPNFLLQNGYKVYGTDASGYAIAIVNQINPRRFPLHVLSSDEHPAELPDIKFDTLLPI